MESFLNCFGQNDITSYIASKISHDYIQGVYIICVYLFQIDQSQLNIYWSSFIDVEAYGHSSYHSGILKYEYGIGM